MELSESLKNSITCDQARYIHAIWLPAAIGLFAAAGFVYWVYKDIESTLTLNLWFSLCVFNTVFQIGIWFRFFRVGVNFKRAQQWLRWSPAYGFIAALVWVTATIFVLPKGGEMEQLMFVFVLAMIGISSIFSVGPHQATFAGFFHTSLISLTIMIGVGQTAIQFYFSFVLLTLIGFSSAVAYFFSRMFLHSLQLRLENVELLEQLTIQKDAAESANLAKSRFLAAASHDLRQPMHALSLYLGAMSEEASIKGHKMLTRCLACANTMEEMFRALLDISRLDAEVVKPEFSAFPIGPLLEQIFTEFEPEAHAKGVQIHFVPNSLIVDCDQALLGRVLRNLVSNAVRYTQTGKILMGCRRRANFVIVALYDTGIGIPKETQKTIFEEFYQVGNPERDRNKGLGLGLAIVDRIVKMLAISMEFRSQVNLGTQVHLTLSRSLERNLPETNTMHTAHKGSLSGKIAVIVDDETEILNATRALLESWQMEVYTANNNAEIKTILVENNVVPNVLVCDYRLRDNQNGLDVINMIREEFNHKIPAVLITGDTASHQIQTIAASGLLALHKPIDKNELQTALLSLTKTKA